MSLCLDEYKNGHVTLKVTGINPQPGNGQKNSDDLTDQLRHLYRS